MESELFGHERGAFTGADRRREGCFELATGGTLLLDEIGEMKPELQAKLLRVLEERKIRRLGGSAEIPVDVRVLAATNRNLELQLREGKFREDLYYRLNVFTIQLPTLRERSEDFPTLIEHFLRQLAPAAGKSVVGMEADCIELLRSQRWPGNVRQLRNVIERALIVTRGPMISAEICRRRSNLDRRRAATPGPQSGSNPTMARSPRSGRACGNVAERGQTRTSPADAQIYWWQQGKDRGNPRRLAENSLQPPQRRVIRAS